MIKSQQTINGRLLNNGSMWLLENLIHVWDFVHQITAVFSFLLREIVYSSQESNKSDSFWLHCCHVRTLWCHNKVLASAGTSLTTTSKVSLLLN